MPTLATITTPGNGATSGVLLDGAHEIYVTDDSAWGDDRSATITIQAAVDDTPSEYTNIGKQFREHRKNGFLIPGGVARYVRVQYNNIGNGANIVIKRTGT